MPSKDHPLLKTVFLLARISENGLALAFATVCTCLLLETADVF